MKFNYSSPKDMFNELRLASKGSVSDYYGMTWETHRREQRHCSGLAPAAEAHPGTPRLYEGRKVRRIPMAKRTSCPSNGSPRQRMPDEEYPIILTTGRVVSQFLIGYRRRAGSGR